MLSRRTASQEGIHCIFLFPATLEVMSPTDVSTITFHQELDCQKCLLMSNKSLRSGKLALVPSVAFDKHMRRGLVLEHHDHHALQEWEGRLRRHLRGRKNFQVSAMFFSPFCKFRKKLVQRMSKQCNRRQRYRFDSCLQFFFYYFFFYFLL